MKSGRKICRNRDTDGNVAPGWAADVLKGESEVEEHELVNVGGEGRVW